MDIALLWADGYWLYSQNYSFRLKLLRHGIPRNSARLIHPGGARGGL